MKRALISIILIFGLTAAAVAQHPIRPDAFPPAAEPLETKAVNMASTIDQMDTWDRYPTYEVYLEMMARFARNYPHICTIDTIGRSVNNRLILSAVIHYNQNCVATAPNFFYSSTIHGDEVTGYYLMLRLIDSLVRGYETDTAIQNLVTNVCIYINPLANPDGTYYLSNNTLAYSRRYNANGVDLNRNWPDPFGVEPEDSLQPENKAMMNYMLNRQFILSANLHGGAEVMNYPWDSFTAAERSHPDATWWQEVSQRFVDTARAVAPNMFRTMGGVTSGGDWYVISNGRQDWANYYANCHEMTMELSTYKTLSTSQLDNYWKAQSKSLINYIREIYNCPMMPVAGIRKPLADQSEISVAPNPTSGPVTIKTANGTYHYDLSQNAAGVYVINVEDKPVRVVKQ